MIGALMRLITDIGTDRDISYTRKLHLATFCNTVHTIHHDIVTYLLQPILSKYRYGSP